MLKSIQVPLKIFTVEIRKGISNTRCIQIDAFPLVKTREGQCLLVPRPEMSLDGTSSIFNSISRTEFVFGLCFRGSISPHVSHEGFRSRYDFTTACPNTEGLIEIFAPPSLHARVISSDFEEPFATDGKESSAHDGDVGSVIGGPFEFGVEGQVTFTHSSAAASGSVEFGPRIDVEARDGWYNNAFVVFMDGNDVRNPISSSRFDVAIEEDDDISSGRLCSRLLCAY
mmetsp:Transcript_4748/g.10449  ORF Transcript_4748/g.10449 Transcript_4748/m.10449 type:complete len:227 (+) Transcript_4748:652-1332(+)